MKNHLGLFVSVVMLGAAAVVAHQQFYPNAPLFGNMMYSSSESTVGCGDTFPSCNGSCISGYCDIVGGGSCQCVPYESLSSSSSDISFFPCSECSPECGCECEGVSDESIIAACYCELGGGGNVNGYDCEDSSSSSEFSYPYSYSSSSECTACSPECGCECAYERDQSVIDACFCTMDPFVASENGIECSSSSSSDSNACQCVTPGGCNPICENSEGSTDCTLPPGQTCGGLCGTPDCTVCGTCPTSSTSSFSSSSSSKKPLCEPDQTSCRKYGTSAECCDNASEFCEKDSSGIPIGCKPLWMR